MLAVDLGRPDAVAAMLATVDSTLPPIRGIVHAAGILADASLLNLDDERFVSVFGPKATGALLLHRAMRSRDLDFFVSFSSMASILGNAGQANYASANAVLDRLAWLRASQGLPAQTINWGPWSEIGMSAAAESQRMFEFGVGQIAPDRGMAALALLVEDPRPESVVLPMDWARFISLVPGASRDPFLAAIREEFGSAGETSRSDAGATLSGLLDAAPEDRQGLLETFVRAELAKVLELEPEDLPLDQPLNTVGLDSLMALELKNRVESSLAISLPIVTLIQGPTVTQLAEDLLVRIEARAASGDGGPTGPTGAGGAPADSDAVSAADVALLLGQAPSTPRI
jgi:NAD(P)-dependent dehydrogenase (short-subunit alcohol dehydrogenase family)/acyl carrier protein